MIRRFLIHKLDGTEVGEGVDWGHFVQFRFHSWKSDAPVPTVHTRKIEDIPDLIKDPHGLVYRISRLDPPNDATLTKEEGDVLLGHLVGDFVQKMTLLKPRLQPEELTILEILKTQLESAVQKQKEADAGTSGGHGDASTT